MTKFECVQQFKVRYNLTAGESADLCIKPQSLIDKRDDGMQMLTELVRKWVENRQNIGNHPLK